MPPHPAAEVLDDILIEACDSLDRASLEAEVELLIRRHLASDQPEELRSAAAILEARADRLGEGRGRVKLWAAVLRRRARAAPPGGCSEG
jgi:ribosomal protein L16/L10AE